MAWIRQHRSAATCLALLLLYLAGSLMGQLQQSGGTVLGAGSNIIGKVGIDQTTPGTTNGVQVVAALPAGGNAIGSITNTTFGLSAGSALVGFVMAMPSGCNGSGTTLVNHNTVGVATGAGTSVSSVTGCIVECFVNNITNAGVTLRIADKAGTPVIWLGGNADFNIPANSNLGCSGNTGVNLGGVVMTSGITAIAGTAAALNLHIVTRE